MERLSKALAGMATKMVYERKQEEAAAEARQLRKTLERLIFRGVSQDELLRILGHEHWENRIALRMSETGLTKEPTQ
jgi:hypothetical protein